MSKAEEQKNPQPDITKLLKTCFIAIGIRYWLLYSKYQTIIANHIEVSTPLNSWKRVLEGLYLNQQNINPYEGDLLHETPLSLKIYSTLLTIFRGEAKIMFIFVDLLTALTLFTVARSYVIQLKTKQDQEKASYAKDAAEYLLTAQHVSKAPYFVLVAYLFNPYSLFNCIGMATTVFHNLFLSLFLLGLINKQLCLGAIALGLVSSISFYPIVLTIPFLLGSYKENQKKLVLSLVVLAACIISIHTFCSKLGSDFRYIRSVYGFILTVPDLQPNIGLFWYFFTEMFDHFRDLFICSFQINATILYLIPLSVKFRKDSFLLSCAVLFLITVFKSYPSVGDVGFVFSLLPCFMHLFSFCQQGFLVSVIVLITSALAPILWHLWIYCNSANANFYFGVTLAFAIAQIFLVTDVLFAQVKREFCLKFGKERKIEGEEANLTLE